MAKYLGEEVQVSVVTKSIREIEYIRCDECGKQILPDHYRRNNDYVLVHTWHNDWGNDSIESHVYRDYCKECAKKIVAEYVSEADGSEELELQHKYLYYNESVPNYYPNEYDDEYCLVEKDK